MFSVMFTKQDHFCDFLFGSRGMRPHEKGSTLKRKGFAFLKKNRFLEELNPDYWNLGPLRNSDKYIFSVCRNFNTKSEKV